MKKVLFFLVLLLLIGISLNSYSQIGWVVQQSGTTASINSLYFVNNATGWFCGNGGVLKKTTNGGSNWIAQVSGTTYNLYSLYFINQNTGWAAGGYNDINTWGHVHIIKTTNGGLNWFIQISENTYFYYANSLYFIDANTGFAACIGNTSSGTSGAILKTTNGGTNWLTGSKSANKIIFINSNTGFCISKIWNDIGWDSAVVYKTTNCGINWTDSFRKNLHTFKNIMFFNQNTGIVQGQFHSSSNNSYFKTTDAGNTWYQSSAGNNYHTNSFFNNELTGWAVGNQIYRTTNGGLNWEVSLSNPSSQLNYITFTDQFNGWSAGNNGVLYRTTYADTTSGNFFPLQVGNVYKYYTWDFPYPNSGSYSKARISKDSVILGNRYFYCYNFPYILNGWVRYDSLSGLLLHLFPGNGCGTHTNEKIIDSLAAKLNNTLNYCPYSSASTRRCSDTSNVTLFGYYTTKRKSFAHDGLIVSGVAYARNIGLINYGSGEPPPVSHYVDLVGCYVNGILYGDTLMTGVQNISSEIPSSYSLNQNYPNPFNPTTKIKFDVVRVGDVKIVVYDVMGREVQTLVNESLKPGTYEASFDGSQLTSGVYFYKITAGDFSQTKKMLLLK